MVSLTIEKIYSSSCGLGREISLTIRASCGPGRRQIRKLIANDRLRSVFAREFIERSGEIPAPGDLVAQLERQLLHPRA